MISELRMDDGRMYMVDSEGNEHEIAPTVDVDVNDYMKWLEPTPYEPMEEFLNKKEGKDMKLLNMYVEKSENNIKDYYEKLLNEEYDNREVVKEFEDLCNKFQEDLAKLAEKTADEKIRLIELEYEDFESGYGIECNPTEEEQEIREKISEELRNLHDKIDEVNAQLEIITSDENSSHHDINYVLHNYGIIDENYKLTPYTPTFVGKEAPKKAGRPKKVSE